MTNEVKLFCERCGAEATVHVVDMRMGRKLQCFGNRLPSLCEWHVDNRVLEAKLQELENERDNWSAKAYLASPEKDSLQ